LPSSWPCFPSARLPFGPTPSLGSIPPAANGFVPAQGEQFNVLSCPSMAGTFANIVLPGGVPATGVYGPASFSFLFTGSGPATNQPLITVERINPANLTISWPAASGNFHLQTSPTLSADAWSEVDSGITLIGANYVLTNPVAGPAAFFRLRSQ
jgi:hypothetical protein